MKVLHLTHTDLDGYGARIVAQKHFVAPEYDYRYQHLENHAVDQWLLDNLNSSMLGQYDKIYMTDISMSAEVAALINDALVSGNIDHFQLFDHHKSALHLNVYEWCTVSIEHHAGCLASGTSLFYQYLVMNWGLRHEYQLNDLVEKVRRYDTWEWHDKHNDEYPKMLNDLLYVYGPKRFVAHCMDYVFAGTSLFTPQEMLVLSLEQERIDHYFNQKKKSAVQWKYGKYNLIVTFADKYHSELGSRLGKEFPDADIVVIVSMAEKKMSFRTSKEGVDLAEIAINFGGGGHSKAAGAPFPASFLNNFLAVLIDR